MRVFDTVGRQGSIADSDSPCVIDFSVNLSKHVHLITTSIKFCQFFQRFINKNTDKTKKFIIAFYFK